MERRCSSRERCLICRNLMLRKDYHQHSQLSIGGPTSRREFRHQENWDG